MVRSRRPGGGHPEATRDPGSSPRPRATSTRPRGPAGRAAYFLHMTQSFFGAGLCEKEERQVVEQKRCAEPFRW